MEDALLEAVLEMRDLLRIIAAPHLAERDKKARTTLLGIVKNNHQYRKAALMMDGHTKQATIVKETGMSKQVVSEFCKRLRAGGLISEGSEGPKMTIPITEAVFECGEGDNEK